MTTPAKSCCCCGPEKPSGLEPRRGFLAKSLALLFGAAAGAVPVVSALAAFLNPLGQKSQAGKSLRIASLETLPEDGTPRRFPVVMERSDAWNHFGQEPVGAVFLRRVAPDRVQAIQVICPHAGCYVDYDEANRQFYCPCHTAHFDLDGKRTDPVSPSPRDLDTLEVELKNTNEVWVTYQTFRTGTPEKKAEA